MVVLDTWTGKQISVTGCTIGDEEERSAGLVAAAGRFLAGCEGGAALVDAAAGTKTRLPELSGEWQAIGTRYVEGSADRHACRHSAGEEKKEARGEGESELTCIALYDIANGRVSYRPESQIPSLDRPGAPVVCSAFRAKLIMHGRFDSTPGGFAFGEGLLAETVNRGEAPVKRIRIRHCKGPSKTISTTSEPRDLFLAGGLLTWDTGQAGADVNEEEGTSRGKLWSYQTSTGRRSSLSLPQTTVLGTRKVRGEYGYSSHAGKTLFWIAATKVENTGRGVSVKASAVYAARPR